MDETLMCPNMSCEGWIYADHQKGDEPPYYYICMNEDCPVTEVFINTGVESMYSEVMQSAREEKE